MGLVIPDALLKDVKVVSFDLFDTVLLRNVSDPKDIFYFLGAETEYLHKTDPERFRKVRISAEKLSKIYQRLFQGKKETSLDSIYLLVKKALHISEETKLKLIKTELEIEDQFIYLNDDIFETLSYLYSKNVRVIFASDMYLPHFFLLNILKKYDLIRNDRQLYLSSELNKTKRNGGRLYDHIITNEGIKYQELLHIGDNLECDYNVPVNKGIRAVHYKRDNPPIDRKKPIKGDKIYFSYLGCTSAKVYNYNSRLFNDQDLNIINSYICGPVLFSYVHWLLTEAHANKIERLYFLARDGQILLKIAEEIKRHLGLNIELRYLYASRHSWVLPSIIDIDKIDEEMSFFKISKKVNIQQLLSRFKLDDIPRNLLDEKLHQYDIKSDEFITIYNLAKFKAVIKDEDILKLIKQKVDESYTLICQYFAQEGLFDDLNYALVDVGWHGTMQNALRRILIRSGLGAKAVRGFYFDVWREPRHPGQDRFLSFLEDTGNVYKKRIWHELTVLMEIFTYATHASTFGFVREGDLLGPVFMPENLEKIIAWGVGKQQEMCLNFAQCLLASPNFESLDKTRLSRVICENFFAFLQDPPLAVLLKLAGFPYTMEQVVDERSEYNLICSPFSLGDLKDLVRKGHIQRENDLWIQGSLKLTEHLPTRLFYKIFYKMISSSSVKHLQQYVMNKLKF